MNARPATCKILEMIDDGLLDATTLASLCLGLMSESDVKMMAEVNGLFEIFEEEDFE